MNITKEEWRQQVCRVGGAGGRAQQRRRVEWGGGGAHAPNHAGAEEANWEWKRCRHATMMMMEEERGDEEEEEVGTVLLVGSRWSCKEQGEGRAAAGGCSALLPRGWGRSAGGATHSDGTVLKRHCELGKGCRTTTGLRVWNFLPRGQQRVSPCPNSRGGEL